MCDFFSGLVKSNCMVLTLGNTSSHEEMIKHFSLDDKQPLDKRDWVRFELTPKKTILSDKEDDWVFNIDEDHKPRWFKNRHEKACWNYLKKKILTQPWMRAAKKEIRRIKKIKWFKPMDKPDTKDLLPLAQEIGKAFKIRGKIKVKLIPLADLAAWSAANSAVYSAAWSAADSAAWSAADSAADSAVYSAAWSAARSAADSAARSAADSAADSAVYLAAYLAARSAARSAAFECSIDINKKYKTNPFKLLMDFWEKGYYCCGIHNKTLTLGYIPKKKNG